MIQGIKNDSGKRQWWYLDSFWPSLEDVVEVLEYGDSKYPAPDGANWKRLDNPEKRFKDALFRHLVAYRLGEKNDKETGKSHLAHLITNALILMHFDKEAEKRPVEPAKYWCETCEGVGTIDETLGGVSPYARSDQECPDCSGEGYWIKESK